MSTHSIYVVVMSTGGALTPENPVDGGPIVMETDLGNATLAHAQRAAARLERKYGACRIGRVVFEDHPAFTEPSK